MQPVTAATPAAVSADRIVFAGTAILALRGSSLHYDSNLLVVHPHNSNPRPANAAALLKHEEAATSAASALDAGSSGSDATADWWSWSPFSVGMVNRPVTKTALPTS